MDNSRHQPRVALALYLLWALSCFLQRVVSSIVDKDFLACGCNDEFLIAVLSGDLACSNEQPYFLASFLWLVLLDHMTAVADDFHLVLSLHVGDS